MNTREPEPTFVRAPGFVARRVAGETLLVSTSAKSVDPVHRAADLLVLNETGERVWQKLAEPASAGVLARHLIQDFEVDPQTARADVEAFLTSMLDVGAVVRANIDPEA